MGLTEEETIEQRLRLPIVSFCMVWLRYVWYSVAI